VVTIEKGAMLDRLMNLQKEAGSYYQWRQMEAVWLKEKLGMSGTEVAEALNYRVQTVHLIWHRWKRKGFEYLEKSRPGGRKRAYLNEEQEEELLRPFVAEAKRGGILAVSDIRKAFEDHVGHSVAESTVYRLLARHGWRKVAPRKRHPKADPSLQEKAKKT